MKNPLPKSPQEVMNWRWEQFAPLYAELAERPVNAENVSDWLADWSRVSEWMDELENRLYVAVTSDTANGIIEAYFIDFTRNLYPKAQEAEQTLKKILLESGLEPEGFEIPLRNMRAEAALFRSSNLPLLAQEKNLCNEYDKVIGAQTVMWEGEEHTIDRMNPVLQHPDRAVREKAWQLTRERQLADKEDINALWKELIPLRQALARNADLPDYRAYRWSVLQRFEYTPEDCKHFHDAIEEVVVPAAARILERRRQRLGLDSMRPWDLNVDPYGKPPLRPFQSIDELVTKTSAVFHQVDPRFGEYFDTMSRENLLDLDNRKNKAPGGYCTGFNAVRKPFIFTNAVGIHNNVQTLLHEGGHSFHVFESAHLPYLAQLQYSNEIAEVASMSMELLASPYLSTGDQPFYTPGEAARARIEHLEESILFWLYMAVVDAFQHWVYENPKQGSNPDACDAQWGALWDRFMCAEDWSGLEDAKVTGWHRKAHIHQIPFYYVEYGLAQLGAVQVWRNSLTDQQKAISAYRQALSLAGTRPLTELFQVAGAKLAFDAQTLGEAVALIEKTITELEEQID